MTAESRGAKGRRVCAVAALLGASLWLGGCAGMRGAEPVAAPKIETLPELMHQAETAAAAGEKDKARDAYRAAAKIDPTAKAPWLKLAESYFEAGDYGNTVLAAQEVLHRDGNNGAAAGILAVSGLRVSTAGLSVLRQQNAINAGTRGEAEALARHLRDLLGEPVLVPRPAAEPVASPPAKRRVRAKAPADTPAGNAAAAPAAARANPFDKLK